MAGHARLRAGPYNPGMVAWVQVSAEVVFLALLGTSWWLLRAPRRPIGANARIRRAQLVARLNLGVAGAMIGFWIGHQGLLVAAGWAVHAVGALGVCLMARRIQFEYVLASQNYARQLLLHSRVMSS